MVNEADVQAAVEQWIRYKQSLAGARRLQDAGFSVPSTKMRDFQGEINAASRRLVSALGTTNTDFLEALGELCLNAQRNIVQELEW